MYKSFSMNDMPQMVRKDEKMEQIKEKSVSSIHNKTIEEKAGIIKDGKLLGKFELDDIILIAIIIILVNDNCDDKLLLLAIVWIFFS